MPQTLAVPEKFEIKPVRIGRPRFDRYYKLLSRLYEVLVLLLLLGQSRGEHTPRPIALDEATETRRRFLQNLAYICDFEKGGRTCTAVGLEESETCYRIWLACNEGNDQTTAFLQTTLASLQKISKLPEGGSTNKIEALSKLCIEFAAKRIGKERKCLLRAAKQCIEELSKSKTKEAKTRAKWLERLLIERNDFQLCTFAYDICHPESLPQLQLWSAETQRAAGSKGKHDSFASTKHFLGRLAHHVHAPQQLCADATYMSYMLQSYETCDISPIPCAPSPSPDVHTNLDGILNRMLGTNHKERSKIERGLHYLNSIKGIFSQFLTEYNGLNPRVHAEVQVLEHFYNNQLVFAGNDRFIACSKPACLCCEMYFKYHPARMVVPESHRKVWINWGPPLIRDYSQTNSAAIEQRYIVNKIIDDISELIISQVLEQVSASHWHPDSRTGISDLLERPRGWANLWKDQPVKLVSSPVESPVEQRSTVQKLREYSARYEASGESDEDSDLDDGGVSLI